MWEATVRKSMTGVYFDRVYPASFDWSTSVLGDGEATIVFKIDDEEIPLPRAAADLFVPNAHSIDLRWGAFVAFHGKIEDWAYDRDAGTVTVAAVELANELKWRMPYGVNAYELGTLDIPGRTHAGAIARILARFMQWSPEWVYPIDLPADAPGSFTATWEYWRKARISDLIEQVRAEGYEMYLRPYVAESGATRLQTRVAPRVTLETSSFNLSAAELPLAKIRYKVDGARQLTGLQGVGNGSGQDQPTAWAGAPAPSIPIRDAKADFPDMVGARLQAATNAALAADAAPVTQWSVGEFNVSEEWGPEHAAVGRVWQIDSHGDPVIPDGTHTLRVIRASGSLGTVINTEVQNAA